MVEKLTKNTFSSMSFYFMYIEFYVLTINKEASKQIKILKGEFLYLREKTFCNIRKHKALQTQRKLQNVSEKYFIQSVHLNFINKTF